MKTFKGALVLAAILSVATPALAQEQQMDQQKMMELMEKLATPGEMHKKLEPFVGTFDVEATFWMDPSQPPLTTKGTAVQKWILGGRYLQQDFQGEFMGQPFTGQGLTGYDNYKKEYFGTWIDSMSTTMMVTTGKVDGNTWTYTGKMDDPMSNTTMDVTEKIILHGNDHHVMEMWMPGPDGKPFKNMEIQYRRAK